MKMLSPEQLELLHASPGYDPRKAHEYYMRVRKLKGRHSAIEKVSKSRPKGSAVVLGKASKKVATAKETSKQRREEVHARVEALKKRLDRLHDVLAQLVEQAKKRSGVNTKSSAAKSSPSTTVTTKHKTAQEKSSAAKSSKEYYDKHKKDNPSSKTKDLETSIKQVEEKIRKIRAELKAAVEKAKQQSSKPKSKASITKIKSPKRQGNSR